MTKELLKEYIRNLEKDIGIITKEKYHQRCHDLMQMVFLEDLPEILKMLKKVNKVFDIKTPKTTGSYQKGYYDGIEQIERELFDE